MLASQPHQPDCQNYNYKKTWEKNLSWDCPVDSEIETEFRHSLEDLHFLFKIKVTRWIHRDGLDLDHASLHGPFDVSKSSYASINFFSGVCEGRVFIHSLAATSRVAL